MDPSKLTPDEIRTHLGKIKQLQKDTHAELDLQRQRVELMEAGLVVKPHQAKLVMDAWKDYYKLEGKVKLGDELFKVVGDIDVERLTKRRDDEV